MAASSAEPSNLERRRLDRPRLATDTRRALRPTARARAAVTRTRVHSYSGMMVRLKGVGRICTKRSLCTLRVPCTILSRIVIVMPINLSVARWSLPHTNGIKPGFDSVASHASCLEHESSLSARARRISDPCPPRHLLRTVRLGITKAAAL